MLRQFDAHVADRGYPWRLADILPTIVPVGETTGRLTEEGAKLFDPSGKFEAGVPLCPPEGDAGTGMVKELRLLGNEAPIFMLSSAGDNLSMATDYSAIGLAGVFQKPVSKDRLLSMLKAKLG